MEHYIAILDPEKTYRIEWSEETITEFDRLCSIWRNMTGLGILEKFSDFHEPYPIFATGSWIIEYRRLKSKAFIWKPIVV